MGKFWPEKITSRDGCFLPKFSEVFALCVFTLWLFPAFARALLRTPAASLLRSEEGKNNAKDTRSGQKQHDMIGGPASHVCRKKTHDRNFPPAILGPETAAPAFLGAWDFGLVSAGKPHAAFSIFLLRGISSDPRFSRV